MISKPVIRIVQFQPHWLPALIYQTDFLDKMELMESRGALFESAWWKTSRDRWRQVPPSRIRLEGHRTKASREKRLDGMKTTIKFMNGRGFPVFFFTGKE